jgi:hypothetical protein
VNVLSRWAVEEAVKHLNEVTFITVLVDSCNHVDLKRTNFNKILLGKAVQVKVSTY